MNTQHRLKMAFIRFVEDRHPTLDTLHLDGGVFHDPVFGTTEPICLFTGYWKIGSTNLFFNIQVTLRELKEFDTGLDSRDLISEVSE